jgi:hypothetical protein
MTNGAMSSTKPPLGLWLTVRLFEWIGVSRFYRAVAPAEFQLPPARAVLQGASASREHAKQVRKEVAYYSGANIVRVAIYVPIAMGLGEIEATLAQGVLLLLTLFHALCVAVELYKYSLAGLLEWRGTLTDAPIPRPTQLPEPTGWFAQRRFESVTVYRRLGFEFVRSCVLKFMDLFGGGRDTIRDRQGMYEYRANTMASEVVHLVGALLYVPMLIPLALASAQGRIAVGFAVYAAVLMALDLILAALQRYHRTRVNAVIARGERK